MKSIKGVGPATLRQAIIFLELNKSEMISSINRKYSMVNEQSYAEGESYARKQIEIAEKLGHEIISFLDPAYPNSLRVLPNSPVILYLNGDLDFLSDKCVAVIGTRDPTNHGKKIAERVTRWLCENGWQIVSGLAKGVDTLGHQICIDAGMKTAAVLAHGLDSVYPKENQSLAEKIVISGGVLISEYPYGVTVRPAQLVQRDKIQAALSAGVVLVQSSLKGGSLHASRETIRYNRPLIVVGQSLYDEQVNKDNIMANIVLLDDDDKRATKLLRTNSYPFELVIKMHSKDDYPLTLKALKKSHHSFTSHHNDQKNSSNSFLF